MLDKSQLTILVVDDDEMGLDVLTRRLTREEFNVESAASGQSALKKMALEKFDVVLLDLMMPDMSGDQVLSEIRKMPSMSDAVVIMLTADNSRESVTACLEGTANDYIVKPYDYLSLKSRIWQAVKSRPLTNRGLLSDKSLLVSKRVLIVDDNEDIRNLLACRCKQFGSVPECVNRGEAALQRLDARHFDIVLLDIHMPGMNGIEVLKKIREQERFAELPVLMVSAEDNEEILAECIHAGASDYIAKPFNAVVVRARMQACLRAQEQAEDSAAS